MSLIAQYSDRCANSRHQSRGRLIGALLLASLGLPETTGLAVAQETLVAWDAFVHRRHRRLIGSGYHASNPA